MRTRFEMLSVSAFIVTLAMSAGCGGRSDELPRVKVTGTATLAGQPLPAGAISIQPLDGNPGPAANGEITNGKFYIGTAEGPIAGPHKFTLQFMPAKDELMRLQDAGQDPQTSWDFTLTIPDESSYHHDFVLE